MRFDAKFDGNAWHYRADRNVWIGRPKTKPAVAATARAGKVTVYASWNGSTETAHWRVSAGARASSVLPAKTVSRSGFETAIPIAGRPHFVAVTALDHARRPLGTSRTVAVR